MNELLIVREALDLFEQKNITYCHWKSNEHVKEGLCGITDLDILVDHNQKQKVYELLVSCGYKFFVATFGIKYQGIEDFIGLDESTGKIVHLHMHYQMTLGEKYLKGYCLPWDKVILETRKWDPENRIYISDPNVELILLLVRAALKWSLRNRVSSALGKKYFRGDFKREYLWLLERIEKSKFDSYCRQLLGMDENQLYSKLVGETFVMHEFMKFRRLVLKRLAPYKTYRRTAAIFWKSVRELSFTFSVFRKKYLKMDVPVRRTLPTGGILVAMIGSDGSGKSTVVKKVVEQFSWKIDATHVYFGSGGGKSSLLRYPLKVARGLFLKAPGSKQGGNSSVRTAAKAPSTNKSSLFYQAAKLFWALTLWREKKQKLRSAWKNRQSGMVVITDRYPQTQVKGINDGPLLSQWLNHRNKWLRSFASKELKAYQSAEGRAPDLVIRLNVTPEIAASRKNDMTFEEFTKKIEVVRSLEFKTKVVEVDATKPLNEVLLEVKKAIWAQI
ncbi:hypothetical protein [Paenibacillus montanisoli]|uniref:Thymidylate kinase n=1 Tax=Paenibacillus montanisoli TaxID=2081970 RepID=A0A328U3T9_9BACL|nr:hypothetical protein [Paenibacillus montanisoli]RAP77487.1 hypothetical protein DL346_03125 [Paenibacillus montanisoli]